MKRTDFVRGYAERSGLSSEWDVLGFVTVGNGILLALPCGCSDETCEGWAMVHPDGVLDHLQMYAPENLRDAYDAAVRAANER